MTGLLLVRSRRTQPRGKTDGMMGARKLQVLLSSSNLMVWDDVLGDTLPVVPHGIKRGNFNPILSLVSSIGYFSVVKECRFLRQETIFSYYR